MNDLDYIESAYYILVSLSTIGYGDIYASVAFCCSIAIYKTGMVQQINDDNF